MNSSQHQARGRWPRVLLAMLLVGVAGTGMIGVGFARYLSHQAKEMADPKRARNAGRPIPVRTEQARKAHHEVIIGATAITEPSQTAIIRFGGGMGMTDRGTVVSRVLAKEGQYVKQGDILFEVDSRMFRLSLKQKDAALVAAIAEFDAIKKLNASGSASGLEVKASQAKYELAKFEVEAAQRDVEACKIHTPINGHVNLVNAVPGQFVEKNVELTKVYQLDPIRIRADLPQERVGDASVGQRAEVIVDSFPQENFAGLVIGIGAEVDVQTRVLPLVIEMPNPDQKIKAGVSGFVRLRKTREVLVVPDIALVRRKGKASVFVVQDATAHLREVKTGSLMETGRRIIESGILAGDHVVVFGQQNLQPDDPVDTNWRDWMRRK